MEYVDSLTFKTCPKCTLHKPTSDYFKDCTRPDGWTHYCKVCNASYKRKKDPERYGRHREANIARQLSYRNIPEVRLAGLLSQAKRRSGAKRLPFDLDITWAMDNYTKQNGACLLTGIPFVLESNPENYRKRNSPYSVSIDRIDSDKGYTKDNCRLICVIVNCGLNRFGEDAFKRMCVSYLQHQTLEPSTK